MMLMMWQFVGAFLFGAGAGYLIERFRWPLAVVFGLVGVGLMADPHNPFQPIDGSWWLSATVVVGYLAGTLIERRRSHDAS